MSFQLNSMLLLTSRQVLAEIQRIMLQDATTKDVFRELDGFLVRVLCQGFKVECTYDWIGVDECLVDSPNRSRRPCYGT